ncbi:hypothetical protein GEV39_18215 [Pseudomonas sp. NY5710]|uniref:hypothetical protein n=1 Tax=Pseudomonas sp. NY5710 TaxID=2662033 RepID=UPI00156F58C6|nr:hypothetical protein [Pseudomonas sp. NY5710]QKL03187.1 hypothetical protein GEV39_18215 [Pseudomonas sp. NY5710]
MSSHQSRVDQLITIHNEATSKFDYFILGATLAACAYLAQTNPYERIGLNEATLLLLSLLIFAASAACGFKRIEANISYLRINAAALAHPNNQLRAETLQRLKKDREAHRWYKARNVMLVLGLACYLATNVWATYQSNGWIPV